MRLTRRWGCFATPMEQRIGNTQKNLTRTTMESANERRTTNGTSGDERWVQWSRWIGWSLVAVILLTPAIAMQFTDDVAWTAGDFLFAAVLLIGTGLLAEWVVRHSSDTAYRMGAGVALMATLLLAWSNAAVGFVGAGANTANILYVALLGMVVVGSFVAGFRAPGMAKAMIAAAVGQGLVLCVAFAMDLVQPEETRILVLLTLFFIALWSAAAALFTKAARRAKA